MKPYPLHVLILALLILPGIALFFLEYFSVFKSGWIFSKYIFTKLYWITYMIYMIGSTFIVTFVHLFLMGIKRRFTKLTVILSHVIPVAVLFLFLLFGIHDRIQNMMKKPDANQTINSTLKKQTKRPPIPQTPLSKRFPLEDSDTKVEQPKSITPKDSNPLKEK